MRKRKFADTVLTVRPQPGDDGWIRAEAKARGISSSELARALLSFAITTYRDDPSKILKIEV